MIEWHDIVSGIIIGYAISYLLTPVWDSIKAFFKPKYDKYTPAVTEDHIYSNMSPQEKAAYKAWLKHN